MEVTNNTTAQNYNYNSTKTQEVKTTPSAFDSLLEEKKEVPEKKEETAFISFLEKYNRFDSLSETEEKTIREILSDNKITNEEMNSLSYEQAEKISNIILHHNISGDEFGKMPIVFFDNQKVLDMMWSTTETHDSTFNEAMYKMVKDVEADYKRHNIISGIRNDLSEINASRNQITPYMTASKNYLAEDIDGGKFIGDMIDKYEEILNSGQNSKVKEFSKFMLDNGYGILQKNYNDIKNKEKEIYA